MTSEPTKEGNTAVPLPDFIYGTAWKEEATQNLVETALKSGFTAIDTANQRKHYFEQAVGAALQTAYDQGITQRQNLFLQTKFTYQAGQDDRLPYDPEGSLTDQVYQSFQSSLEHLHTDYLDAYLLHGPSQRESLGQADLEVWSAMESLYRAGHIKRLGVSNFSARQLEDLTHHAAIRPVLVQNRCFAQLGWDMAVRDVCKRHKIGYQGFSLLTANPIVGTKESFQAIVVRTGLTPAQVIFQACQRMGMICLTGTSNENHMQQDLDCNQVMLTDEEVSAIETICLG